MSITLTEVIENGLLSDELLDCLPETCQCGSEIEFTDSLRQVFCPNPRCLYKVAARLEAMAKKLQADGWGESTCQEVCREFKLISPYQVFLLPESIKKGSACGVAAFEKKVASICDPERRKVKLWEVVKLGGIPNIETIAYKIFDGYETMEDAYTDIESGQVPFIAERLGLKNSETGVLANNVYQTLKQYKEELLFAETQFEVYKPTGMTLCIAITGGVSGFRNKSEYVNYLNNRYSGKFNIILMNSVTSDIDILVADGDSSSKKFKNAMKINDKYLQSQVDSGISDDSGVYGAFSNDTDICPYGCKIFVTTSTDLIERLDTVYNNI